MNKTVKIALVTVAGVGIFSAGLFGKDTVKTLAGSDWQTTEYMDANTSLGKTGYDKKEELKASAPQDINAKIDTEIGATVDQQKAELEALLEQYYQMKLDNLINTPEYKTLEEKIAGLKTTIFERYKAELDTTFAAQTTQP